MDLRTELTYDAAPDDVFAMLCDRRFREQVCVTTNALQYDVFSDATAEAGGRIRVHRVMPLPANIPDIARKFVGETIEIVQTEDWGAREADGVRTARLRVEVPGKPAEMDGRRRLAPNGAGASDTVTGDVRVSVPLFGGKLEKEISRGLLAALEVEGRVGRAWLAGDR